MTEHPQLSLLIAYADGRVTDVERLAAEGLVASDPSAAEILAQLEATDWPYAEAFEPLLCPAPSSIVSEVERHSVASRPLLSRRALVAAALLAALGVGGIGGVVLRDTGTLTLASQTTTQLVPEWVQLVADYHSLYVRETVTHTPPQTLATTEERVSDILKRKIQVPDLTPLGIEFRRAQLLSIGTQPLIQLAYLPAQGRPIAVCILQKAASHTQAVKFGENSGLRYAHWQRGKLAVIVVGDMAPAHIERISDVVSQELFARI